MIRLVLAPIRSIVRFPLLQLAIVIGVILWLQAADDRSTASTNWSMLRCNCSRQFSP